MLFFLAGFAVRFACNSFFRILILWVSLKKDEWFFLIGDDILKHFGSSEFGFINDSCVILLAVIVPDGVLVVIEDAAS